MLKTTFIKLVEKYTKDNLYIEKLWPEIETNYTSKKRHYHNLSHLKNMLLQLEHTKDEIKDWDIVLFALYYHDIIYNIYKKDNELKSAEFAKIRLTSLSISSDRIEQCYQQIIATKNHKKNKNKDINFFVDADLSILGIDEKSYFDYVAQIRKEYAIFPTIIYNLNRIKVLNSFLNKPKIYHTTYFFDRYEKQARKNMNEEIKTLKR